MKKYLILFIKGFIMGIANIIPGVSGGTLAIILGIYEDFIGAISHFFSNFKKNILFIIPVVLGMGVSILSMSSLISFAFKKGPLPTTLFFVGLVIGGIPLIFKKLEFKNNKNLLPCILTFILTFSLVIVISFGDKIFGFSSEVVLDKLSFFLGLKLFGVGVIASGTMIIPGISGSLVLMMLGYYYPIIDTIKEFVHFNNLVTNFTILAIFGIGILIGIILISKIIEFLFKKFEKITYFGVMGFIMASIPAIIYSALKDVHLEFNILIIILSIIVLPIGYVIAYKLGEK